MNYWHECISEAFGENGIKATDKQIVSVADFVSGAHEQYGMAFGHDAIPDPQRLENDKLKLELAEEREKVHCTECGGSGSITCDVGLSHYSVSQCSLCHGKGRYTPR